MLIDKPSGITSMRVTSRIKHLRRVKKAGHVGTLDPLASGMLPIACGKATKLIPQLIGGMKTYAFTIHWGLATDTEDREGHIIACSDHIPSPQAIAQALPHFVGPIMQKPSAYSAIKVNGRPVHERCRRGEKVDLPPRPVTVYHLAMLPHDPVALPMSHSHGTKVATNQDIHGKPPVPTEEPNVNPQACQETRLLLRCGAGTYVRALARDLAHHLGTHGHVSQLRRLSVAPFAEENMIPLDLYDEMSHKGSCWFPLPRLLDDILAPARVEVGPCKTSC